MADIKKYLSLTGLSQFLTYLQGIFASKAQGAKAETAYNHASSSHAPSNAERNIIVGIQKNGSDISPDSSRKVNITVPTKISQLTNDSGYKTTDNNTTYTLSKSGSTIALTGSDGSKTTVTDSNTTYGNMKGATSSTAGSSGLVPSPAAGSQGRYLRGDGTWQTPTNTTYSTMVGATSDAAGKSGLVPAPSIGSSNRYLRSDGTWSVPPDTKYTLPTASSSTLGGVKTTSSVTSTSGLTACPIISGVPYYKDTNTTYTLSSFGITSTAAELNYVDGVTSNIQTQLNGKASSSHGHGTASSSSNGFMSSADKTKLDGITSITTSEIDDILSQ